MRKPQASIVLFGYGGINKSTHDCLMRDAVSFTMASDKLDLSLEVAEGDALIDRLRSVVATDFLEHTKLEVLVMIDHDLLWMGADGKGYPGDLLHLIGCCMETHGIVGGVVAKKAVGKGIASMLKRDELLNIGSPGLVECHYLGAAFTAYHRDALQAVRDRGRAYPGQPMLFCDPGFWPLFLPMIVPHPTAAGKMLHLSEDWAFCHRATELGYKSHLATQPRITHWGMAPYRPIEEACNYGPQTQPTATMSTTAPAPAAGWHSVNVVLPMEHLHKHRTISLLHASRGRPEMCAQTMKRWFSSTVASVDLEYIISVDADDPALIQYQGLSTDGARIIVGENSGCVSAYNRAAEASHGEILVQVHDDLQPPQGWDRMLLDAIPAPQIPTVLRTAVALPSGALINPEKPDLITVAIVSRGWYERTGYLYHPGYASVFCDDDLTATATKAGAVVDAKYIHFTHHWKGKAGDETMKRSYSKDNWEAGERLYAERQAAGFPLR